ncbi:fatty acid [Cordyceps militaris]|uniref:Fatty acid n=1 Tax=Cordyceps militaris TaxID=73501 RepID=A0A2H4SIN0_CORMI|nr:fatty acid [Cordyceps militaris]
MSSQKNLLPPADVSTAADGASGHATNGHSIGPKNRRQQPLPKYPKPSKPDTRANQSHLTAWLKLRAASRRPLPTEMGDGTYRLVKSRPTLLQDLRSMTYADFKTIKDIVKAKLKRETQTDDKTMLMERTIQLVAGLPDFSRRQEILTNDFIDKLWYSLEHPPLLYMGDQYRFRQADGSHNNPIMPRLGAAGTAYSRSCKPRGMGLGALPPPETIFESIMARDEFQKNPNNVSSILWYWATIIIHDLFNSDPADGNINNNSSYLDLSPLYGNSQEQQDSIRTFEDGKLKPDAFADKRMLGNPPGVCIILVMFNRFHNYIAENLAAINEANRFPQPSPDLSPEKAHEAWKKYDEELFQTARLVTSGLYINITLIDYVRNIVNLNRADTTWTLDPRQEMGVAVGTKEGSQSGVGNAVSAEFNLCYRWHSCISKRDEVWMQEFFSDLLGGGDQELDLASLRRAMEALEKKLPQDPGQCCFGGFTRGADGRFDDDDLMGALTLAIEEPGGAFGARNVPRIMKPIEALGIIRGRKWHVASLNEFRKQFGMKAYDTFEEINSDPYVADQLRHLYQHPDNVELYPGIVAEEAKQPMAPGVGIAPTFTISRVVLSDAVALVRGDRHYTTDYHTGTLTNWGFNEANYDLGVNHGCVFYKLFIRAFPSHFRQNSVYAHYPMATPAENRKILANMGRAAWFDFDRPARVPAKVDIISHRAFQHVLGNETTYHPAWEQGLGYLMNERSLRALLASGPDLHAIQRASVGTALFGEPWKAAVKAFYTQTTDRLLAQKSYRLAGQPQIDIVRDVGNLVHTHFVARVFNLPIKTAEHPTGVFSEQELFQFLTMIYICIFLDYDPVKSFPLRRAAKAASAQLGALIEANVKLGLVFGIKGLYVQSLKKDVLARYGHQLVRALAKTGLNAHEIAWSQILPTAGAMVPNQAQMFAQSVDWYLSAEGAPYRDELERIAAEESSDAGDALLLGYAMEGVRMAGTFSLYRTVAAPDTITDDQDSPVPVQHGDTVFVSVTPATRDSGLPHPDKVDPRRPLDAYVQHGLGPELCLGREVAQTALVALFRALFRKKNLRRVPGLQGELKRLVKPDGSHGFMTEDWGTVWPFPTSMKLMWDDE